MIHEAARRATCRGDVQATHGRRRVSSDGRTLGRAPSMEVVGLSCQCHPKLLLREPRHVWNESYDGHCQSIGQTGSVAAHRSSRSPSSSTENNRSCSPFRSRRSAECDRFCAATYKRNPSLTCPEALPGVSKMRMHLRRGWSCIRATGVHLRNEPPESSAYSTRSCFSTSRRLSAAATAPNT